MSVAPTHPKGSGKNAEGDLGQFKDFMRKLVSVPHEEVKARLKAEKLKKRTPKTSASRAPVSS